MNCIKLVIALIMCCQLTWTEEAPGDSVAPWNNSIVPVLEDQELIQSLDEAATPSQKDSLVFELDSAQQVDTQKPTRGAVRGVVLDRDKQTPLSGVLVIYSSGTQVMRATTSSEGLYGFGVLPPGTYQIEMSKKGFNPFKKSVLLGTGGEVREVRLEKRVPVARMIEVKQPKKQGSAMDLRKKRAKASGVVEGMSAEQIAKSTDSDAGSLARRVTGTSLVGGRYVFVRGLGERYTNMTFNGLPISSPEKDKRVVPQDLFPASSLESFTIAKTFTPELLPDFAGGSIGLVTRGVPSADIDKVSMGVSALDYSGDGQFTTLGQTLYTYEGGSLDYLGFDDGTRARPDGVPQSIDRFTQEREEIADYARRFNNIWLIDSTTIQPNTSYGYTHARVFPKDSVEKHGYLMNVSFKNSYSQNSYTRYKLNPGTVKDADGQIVRDTVIDGDTSYVPLQYVQKGVRQDLTDGKYKTTLAGMVNYGWNNRDHVFWSKNFFANLSEDRVRRKEQFLNPNSSASEDTDYQETFNLEYSRRHLLTNQIGGGHYLGVGIADSMSWAAGFTWTQGETPDARNYLFVKNYQNLDIENDTIIDGESYQAGDRARVLPESHSYETKAPYGMRSYEEFGEYNISGRADFYLHFPPEMYPNVVYYTDTTKYKLFSHWELPSAQVGLLTQYRDRHFDLVRYDYRRDGPSIVDSNGSYDVMLDFHHPDSVADYVLEEGTGFKTSAKDYDTYNAQEAQVGAYFQSHFGFRLWGILTGLHMGGRYEYYHLSFNAPFTGTTPVPAEDSLRSIRVNDNLFYPSVSLDFEIVPQTKTRLIYSKTRVRPEMRERAPTVFFDTENSIEVVGNPDLEDIEISHYDLRFDYDLGKNQFFSLSLFYKNFEKPIESVIDANAVPELQRLQNASGAIAYGFETEIDLKLNSMIPGDQVDRSFLKDISLYMNYAWIRSEVELDTNESGVALLTSQERPMIGQSPYLFNSKLTHEVKLKKKATVLNSLLYNVVGPRIEALGTDGDPDIYRDPFPSLDYIHKLSWDQHSISLKLKNLLYSKSILRAAEFNHTKEYESIDNTTRDELYSQYDKEIIMSQDVGLSLGLSYSYSFN